MGLIIPQKFLFTRESWILVVALLGTTITPWGQFFVQSYMKDKNVPISRLKYAKLEAYIGSFTAGFFTFCIIGSTAAALIVYHIPLESGEQAALAIKPVAGEFAAVLFTVGLVTAG